MLIITDSKTKSWKLSGLVTSLPPPRDGRVNCLRTTFRPRHDRTVDARAAKDGNSPASVLAANKTQQSASFTVSKCIRERCLNLLNFRNSF